MFSLVSTTSFGCLSLCIFLEFFFYDFLGLLNLLADFDFLEQIFPLTNIFP